MLCNFFWETSDVILRRISQPGGGEVEMVTNLGMPGVTGTLEAINIKSTTKIENNRGDALDPGNLPLSTSSDTAFTSFYGSEANM